MLSGGAEQAGKALILSVELLSLFSGLFCLLLYCEGRGLRKGDAVLALLLTGRIGLLGRTASPKG